MSFADACDECPVLRTARVAGSGTEDMEWGVSACGMVMANVT